MTPPNYLLLDKDHTLGDFPSPGFYPGVPEFLAHQHQQDRKLIIATFSSSIFARQHLKPLDHLIDHYLGIEHFRAQDIIGNKIKDFYLDHNGEIQELTDFRSPVVRYGNPFNRDYVYKDLHLARRYLDPRNYKNLRTVMLGDKNDQITTKSDPFTPVIIISDRQRNGNWQPVINLLNVLYHNPQQMPWEIFDHLHTQRQLHPRHQPPYTTKKDLTNGRLVYMEE